MNLSRPLEDWLGVNRARLIERLAAINSGLTGRRLAEVSGVPPVSALRALRDLSDSGIVTSTQVGRSHIYTLNREHVTWPAIEMMLATPARIEEQIAHAVQEVVQNRATLALYGSFARGDASGTSDIDAAIVWDSSVSDEERLAVLDLLYDRVPAMTGNRIDVVDLEKADLARMVEERDPLINSWRQEARTISGVDLRLRIKEVEST